MGSTKTNALVDTGADISVMSKQFLNKTGFTHGQLKPTSCKTIIAVNGQHVRILGKIQLCISIQNKSFNHLVHVLDNLHHSLILGRDFLKRNEAKLDFSTDTFELDDNPKINTVAHVQLQEHKPGLARTKSVNTIPKRSETFIKISVSRQKPSDNVLLEPLSCFGRTGLIAKNCLVQVKNGTAVMCVRNPTNRDITIRPRCNVAMVAHLAQSEILPVDVPQQNKETYIASVTANKKVKKKIAFNLDKSILSEGQKGKLRKFLGKNNHLFAETLAEVGKAKGYSHHIETQLGARAVRQNFYRQSPTMQKEIDRQIKEMKDSGIIEPSNSEWHSPVVLTKKKNGEYRFVIDYRKLNKVTVPMSFPLPHIESVFDAIGEAKAQYFTSLDLRSGYWQIPLSEESKHKSAFITQSGMYQFNRMPYGLMNSGITFQTMMCNILQDLNWKICLVYVDDILIFSRTFEEHLDHLTQVFQRLHETNLRLRPDKCNFAQKEIKFLGHIISPEGIRVDSDKTSAVSQYPVPKTQKQVRSFLGMANYFRRFLKDHSKIAAPLNALLKKDQSFTWTPECQTAFDTIKQALVSTPVLGYPDNNKPYILTCDASDFSISYILSQVDDQKREYVIAYGGKSLGDAQRNWTTSEKECYAILNGVDAYRPYLNNSHFTVITDHNALTWLKTAKHTGRLARWAVNLQELKMEIVHRPGKSNVVADCLSRRTYPTANPSTVASITQKEEPEDKQVWRTEVTFFYGHDDIPAYPSVSALEIENFQDALNDQESLSKLQKECPDFADLYTYITEGTLPEDKKAKDKVIGESKYYSVEKGILYHWYQKRCKNLPDELKFIQQIAIPKVLRHDALKSYHDSLAGGGHMGISKVLSSLILKYFWPRMYNDVTEYIKSCNRCQRAKRNQNPNNPPMTPMPQVGRGERWHIDVLGPIYKTTEGYEYILVMVDAFTRWTEAFPLKTQSAKEIGTVMYNEVFTRFGCPRVLFSDRGQAFMSKIIAAICEVFEVTQHHTSSYHPNTNGTVERQNGSIAECLRTYCGQNQGNWPTLLPSIMMALRKSPSMNTTGFSPFFMMFGEEMRLPFDVALQPKDSLPKNDKTYMKEFLENLKMAHDIAKTAEAKQKEKDKVRHDNHSNIPDFSLGDQVLLKNHKVPKGLSKKLHDKADGPYKIIELGPHFTYKLQKISDGNKLKSFQNATNLRIFRPPEVHRQKYAIPPTASEDDSDSQSEPEIDTQPEMDPEPNNDNVDDTVDNTLDKFQFSKIIRGRIRNGQRQFYIEWLDGSRSWEPDANFDEDLLKDVNREYTKEGKKRKVYLWKPN